ncbi:MAG: glycosyltransferase [Methanobacteriota archaeon]
MKVLMLLTKPVKGDPRVRKEAGTLLRAGHEVAVLEWARHEPDAPPEESVHGVRVFRVKNTRFMERLPGDLVRNPFWWRLGAREAVRLAKRFPFDVLHCHDLDTLAAGVAAKKKTGARLVFDAHEIFRFMVEDAYPAAVGWGAQLLEDRLLGSVDEVVTVNEPLLDYYRKRTRAPVTIVMNCDEPVAEWSAPKAATFTVSYIGSLQPRFFLPEAVHVLGGLPGVRFVIAGRPEGAHDAVHEASRRYANVEFLGPLPADEVLPKTLEAHAVLAIYDPSARSSKVGVPTKMFVAMGAGRAVIVPEGTHAGEIVRRHRAGLAVPYGKEGLAGAVETLRDDPKLRDEYGRNGLAAAQRTYNWRAQGTQLLKVYERLSGSR